MTYRIDVRVVLRSFPLQNIGQLVQLMNVLNALAYFDHILKAKALKQSAGWQAAKVLPGPSPGSKIQIKIYGAAQSMLANTSAMVNIIM